MRAAAALLRPGGLVCLQEPDWTYIWSSIETPTWRRLRSWIYEAVDKFGVDLRMGPSLFATFRKAGLPDPEMIMEAGIGGGDRSPAFGWANVAQATLPLIERFGIATAAEVDPATLTERLNAEIDAEQGIAVGPCMYGAWATL